MIREPCAPASLIEFVNDFAGSQADRLPTTQTPCFGPKFAFGVRDRLFRGVALPIQPRLAVEPGLSRTRSDVSRPLGSASGVQRAGDRHGCPPSVNGGCCFLAKKNLSGSDSTTAGFCSIRAAPRAERPKVPYSCPKSQFTLAPKVVDVYQPSNYRLNRLREPPTVPLMRLVNVLFVSLHQLVRTRRVRRSPVPWSDGIHPLIVLCPECPSDRRFSCRLSPLVVRQDRCCSMPMYPRKRQHCERNQSQ